jgi:hypothetical protein
MSILNTNYFNMNREELIELVKKIQAGGHTEEEVHNLVQQFSKNVPDPQGYEYIFYGKLTPEQTVDKALSYRPIQL